MLRCVYIMYTYVQCLLATDLYTFDADASSAEATFGEVCDSYTRIFTRLDLPFVQGLVSYSLMWQCYVFVAVVIQFSRNFSIC